MKLTVVGLGLIGGSLALDLKKSGFVKEVIGVDMSAANRKTATRLGLVDHIKQLMPALSKADLVILAVPVDAIAKLLPQVLDEVRNSTTVVDMGSTKEAICKAVAQHPRRRQFVASHPMAGTENSGPEAAHSGLFAGKAAIICDSENSGAPHLARIQALYASLNSRLVFMSSHEHDIQVAYVSHLSHLSSFALANTVLKKEKSTARIFDLAGGGFASTVRLAKSSPEMWAPIFTQNRSAVLAALESYMANLKLLHASLESGKSEDLSKQMTEANQIRRVLHPKKLDPKLSPAERLKLLRQQIDQFDRQLMTLLKERLNTTEEIARIKKVLGLPVLQKKRWIELIQDRLRTAKEELSLNPVFARKLFNLIHDEALRVQRKVTK